MAANEKTAGGRPGARGKGHFVMAAVRASGCAKPPAVIVGSDGGDRGRRVAAVTMHV
jgi:hypothetical protein